MQLTTIDRQGAFTSEIRDAINQNFRLLSTPILTPGKVFWVRPANGADSNTGDTPDSALKTLAEALRRCTANQNDVVLLCGESNTAAITSALQSANLDWNKDAVHLVGINAGGMIGQRSRVANLTTGASFAILFTLSAHNCLISGIDFVQENGTDTLSAAQTCVRVTGMRNRFLRCQISGMCATTLDYAGSNSLTITGSENEFDECYIGVDTIIRATSITEVILSGTPTRTRFNKCEFHTYTSGSTFKMITIPTGADRFVKFIDCDFVAAQNITSAVAPTGVIGITTMNGRVFVRNPYVDGFAQLVTADNAYVRVLGYLGVAVAAGNLVGIAQQVDVA